MTLDELLVRLEWFVREKERLFAAGSAVGGTRTAVEAIEFSVSPGGGGWDLEGVKMALDDARAAILVEPDVSLSAGVSRLKALGEAIATTGKSYLMTEAQNEDLGAAMSLAIDQSGL